jgi:hypothetical protein
MVAGHFRTHIDFSRDARNLYKLLLFLPRKNRDTLPHGRHRGRQDGR